MEDRTYPVKQDYTWPARLTSFDAGRDRLLQMCIRDRDNAEYIPYFRLDLNALPQDFSIHENINPQNGVL